MPVKTRLLVMVQALMLVSRAVVVYEMTYNTAGFFDEKEKAEKTYLEKSTDGSSTDKVIQANWFTVPKETPAAGMVKLIMRSINHAFSTKQKQAAVLALHFQEMKNAGEFVNALKSGLSGEHGYEIDLELLKPLYSKFAMQKDTKYNAQQIQARVKLREEWVKAKKEYGCQLVRIAAHIEKINFNGGVKYECLYSYLFQFVGSIFCVQLDKNENLVLKNPEFKLLLATQYGRSGSEKSSGILGKTFGFKGGFSVRMTATEGNQKFSMSFANMHLSAVTIKDRRSQFLEMFRNTYIQVAEGVISLNADSQEDLINLPSVTFMSGDFNSRTLDNFKKGDDMEASVPEYAKFMNECYAKFIYEGDSQAAATFPPTENFHLQYCVKKKDCTGSDVPCLELLQKLINFEEYYELFTVFPEIIQETMVKTTDEINKAVFANKFFFSPVGEQKINFLPSYSHKESTKAYKTDKAKSFTDRLFYIAKAVTANGGKFVYPHVEGLGYYSDKFEFLADHACVYGMFDVTFKTVDNVKLLPWSEAYDDVTILVDQPSASYIKSFKGLDAMISMKEFVANYATYPAAGPMNEEYFKEKATVQAKPKAVKPVVSFTDNGNPKWADQLKEVDDMATLKLARRLVLEGGAVARETI